VLQTNKPLLSIEQQIAHMEAQGIQFELYTREEAANYLRYHNNYFRLRSYRTGFIRREGGTRDGQFVNLDFAMLRDLAIIDMRLRYVLLQLALDVEHFAKVRLLRCIEEQHEDGYRIVSDYFASRDSNQRKVLQREVSIRKKSSYSGGMASYYENQLPVWVFLEFISFGKLIHFYHFCSERYADAKLREYYYLLLGIRELRNAAAHSDCILNNLESRTTPYRTYVEVILALTTLHPNRKSRSKKMSNARIQQIVTLLYAHKRIVKSLGVQKRASSNLQELGRRMCKHFDYYQHNDRIQTNFEFLVEVIDGWFPSE
jgi:abortive infection bacteriophage resistance protein